MSSQQHTTTNVIVVNQQPQSIKRDWTADLFDVCDSPTECLYAYCCHALFMMDLVRKVNEPCMSCCFATQLRTKIRVERGIAVRDQLLVWGFENG